MLLLYKVAHGRLSGLFGRSQSKVCEFILLAGGVGGEGASGRAEGMCAYLYAYIYIYVYIYIDIKQAFAIKTFLIYSFPKLEKMRRHIRDCSCRMSQAALQ